MIEEIKFIDRINKEGCILDPADKIIYEDVRKDLISQSTLNMAIVALSMLGLIELFLYWLC